LKNRINAEGRGGHFEGGYGGTNRSLTDRKLPGGLEEGMSNEGKETSPQPGGETEKKEGKEGGKEDTVVLGEKKKDVKKDGGQNG